MAKSGVNKGSRTKPRDNGGASPLRGLSTAEQTAAIATVSPQAAAISLVAPALRVGLTIFVVSAVGYIIVKAIQNRFVPLDYRRDLDPANITEQQAQLKADAIENAYGYFGDDFNAVADAFSRPTLLNYNGLVRLYNAYGHRNDMNLIEGIKDHFSDYEVQQIASLVGGVLFN